MASRGGPGRTWSGRAPARRGILPRRACAPILAPVLLQILGGLLSLGVAGGVLERDGAIADEIAEAPFSANGVPSGAPAERPEPPNGTDEESRPASSSDAGNLPASVKPVPGPWPESSRPAAGARPEVSGLKAPLPGVCYRRERLSALPLLVASTPVGGSLSPLSPRGPPAA